MRTLWGAPTILGHFCTRLEGSLRDSWRPGSLWGEGSVSNYRSKLKAFLCSSWPYRFLENTRLSLQAVRREAGEPVKGHSMRGSACVLGAARRLPGAGERPGKMGVKGCHRGPMAGPSECWIELACGGMGVGYLPEAPGALMQTCRLSIRHVERCFWSSFVHWIGHGVGFAGDGVPWTGSGDIVSKSCSLCQDVRSVSPISESRKTDLL